MCSIKKLTNALWITVTRLGKVQFLESLLEVRTQPSVHYGEVCIQFGKQGIEKSFEGVNSEFNPQSPKP
jgi:hypothetical protein